MPRQLTCVKCGTLIIGGYYNAPSGPHCPACWEGKSTKVKKDELNKALQQLASIGKSIK